jgi:hypothetical protein
MLRKENAMRVIRSPALPAVVLVKGPGVCAVAIPDNLPHDEILELASLVLTTSEYEEVRNAVAPGAVRASDIARPDEV